MYIKMLDLNNICKEKSSLGSLLRFKCQSKIKPQICLVPKKLFKWVLSDIKYQNYA